MNIDLQKATWYSKIFIRNLLKYKLETKARLLGKAFSCRVMNGTSSYNLAINSDMSVSCNCQDFDGAGILGDFSKSSLEEILSNEKAQGFRIALAEGRLPILNCARCVELEVVSREQAAHNTQNWRVSDKSLMIENTILCGCSCLSCARTQVMSQRKKLALTLVDIRRIAEEIRKHNIKNIAYFNLGDPFISPNIYQELSIIREINPDIYIFTLTNGLCLNSEEKFEAALMIDCIGFSIDGIDTRMVRKYQRNGDFDRSFKNMSDLVKYRDKRCLKKPRVIWKYVLFNWNDRPTYVKKAVELSLEAKIDGLAAWHTKTPLWGTSWRWYTNNYYRKQNRNNDSQFLNIPLTHDHTDLINDLK